MSPAGFYDKRAALVTTIIVGVIVYGSLFPFAFRAPAATEGPFSTLIKTWNVMPGQEQQRQKWLRPQFSNERPSNVGGEDTRTHGPQRCTDRVGVNIGKVGDPPGVVKLDQFKHDGHNKAAECCG